MKKIEVESKFQIKQLLYSNCVLGIRDNRYRSFGGFQLWWYDKQRDVCSCCDSDWSDLRKKVKRHSLDRAAKKLWNKRNLLFLRSKPLPADRRLLVAGQIQGMQ
jgi:hypothetical protein